MFGTNVIHVYICNAITHKTKNKFIMKLELLKRKLETLQNVLRFLQNEKRNYTSNFLDTKIVRTRSQIIKIDFLLNTLN